MSIKAKIKHITILIHLTYLLVIEIKRDLSHLLWSIKCDNVQIENKQTKRMTTIK